MGKKQKVIDPGLAYLREIGFEKISGIYGISDRLTKVFGKEKAEQLLKQRQKISDASTEFYELKNSDPEISKTFSEAYDSDIIRKACNFIYTNKDYFGEAILEVGCEAGYITGFLAKTFPNAKIVSIDRSKAAVNIASHRIESMGIKNVEFRISSLEEISEQFDTIVCMRTLNENINKEDIPFIGEPLIIQFFGHAALTEDYTKKLLSRLKKDGNLVAFERIGHDPEMCGWMMKLCELGCSPVLETYSEVKCEELEKINTFQAFVCKNGLKEDPSKMIDLWIEAVDADGTGKAVMNGWEALLYLANNAGAMIRGVRVFNKDNYQVGRFAAYYDKDGEPNIYYLCATGNGLDNIYLYSFNKQCEVEVLNHIQEAVQSNESKGLHCEEIDAEKESL